MARVISLERVIYFPCLSGYRITQNRTEYIHQLIPAQPGTLHLFPSSAIVANVRACLFTIPAELPMVRLAANMGGFMQMLGACYVLIRLFFSALFYSRDLHKKEETIVFEAHGMSFPCTELLLFKVNTGFHSMAPLTWCTKMTKTETVM